MAIGKEKFDGYKKVLYGELAKRNREAVNMNSMGLTLTDKNKGDKEYHASTDLNSTLFRNMMNNNITSATIDGKVAKSEDIEKLTLPEFEEKLDELKFKYWNEFHANDIKNIKPLIFNY